MRIWRRSVSDSRATSPGSIRDQKSALDVVAVDGKLPTWFRLVKAQLPLRPVDEAERLALIGGLDRLADLQAG
jgi:hypothetical protein